MAIILRLQGVDAKAGTTDVRAFFESIRIPEGGVCILGGRLREAFITFSTQKDAQLAMRRSGSPLKGSKVSLHISNMAEVERKLKSFLREKKVSSSQLRMASGRPPSPALPSPPSAPASPSDDSAAASPVKGAPVDTGDAQRREPGRLGEMTLGPLALDSKAAFLLGVCTVLQGLQSSTKNGNKAALGVDVGLAASPEVSTAEAAPGYVRLFGLPATTTKEDICQFFEGLPVLEVIVNVKMGRGHCCLVKFADGHDASEALLFNKQPLGSVCVDVRGGTEKMWDSALRECTKSPTANHSPAWGDSLTQETPGRDLSDPSHHKVVMVRNLPKCTTKTELKQLFACPHVANQDVLHLLDEERNRTDTAFLIFNRREDFDYAITLGGRQVGSNTIEVLPVTEARMREMISKSSRNVYKRKLYGKRKPRKMRREAEHGN